MRRVALVTGAAGGIGRASVHTFAEAGWIVVAVDRRDRDGLAADVYVRADVATAEGVSSAIDAVEEVGRLDALVNNAAIQICKPVLALAAAEWDEVMAANVRSAFLLSQGAHRLLRAAGGAIVNVSSVHAIATSANIAAYAASKGALLALTRALAVEFAPDGIRVNAVLPGAVDTPMLHAGLARGHLGNGSLTDQLDALGRRTVLGRVGRPQEIAEAILFLAQGDRSSFITGQVLVVDGGATARLSTE